MTKIKLQSIAINNFKGIRFLKLNMDGRNSNIQGANGSGKTTIYKAYYWCLTGNTLEPNETVQTLDQDNEIIHKIETSVEMVLLIDDSYEVTLERKLVEKWRALGMPDESFTGTEQTQFFNEVPFNKKEFSAKLNSICDLDKWILLSNINTFMSLKTDDRRKMLIEIAGDVDEQKLMAPYPAVMKAVNTEKKSIDELKIQTLSTKKRSNDELKSIPRQIDAQDRLKVNEDFEAKKREKDVIEQQIADIDKQLEGSSEELESSKKHREYVQTLNKELSNAINSWNEKYNRDYKKAADEITVANGELNAVKEEQSIHVEDMTKKAEKIAEQTEAFSKKKDEWNAENQRAFTTENLTSCPTCGHIFTEEEKIERGNKAVEIFNKEKSERLQTLLKEATAINEYITALKGVYNEGKQIIGPEIESRLKQKQTALDEKQKALQEIKERSIDNDSTITELKKKILEAEGNTTESGSNSNKEELRAKKKELADIRDSLTKVLAGEDTNRRIEKEKERLNERAKELAQIVADCDNTLYQIMEYKKSKINTIEDKVNGLFQLAKWKFFKKNIGDDNYKEVCDCLHNGVDYNSTNAADKINLGVDIVSSIGKAYGIEAPIWVDFKESVTNLLEVDNQIISLEVKADSPLTLNN